VSVLVQITSPSNISKPYCAGLVVENDHVVEAAPILRWTIGKHRDFIVKYFRNRGDKVEVTW
jgi:hypothetical protein